MIADRSSFGTQWFGDAALAQELTGPLVLLGHLSALGLAISLLLLWVALGARVRRLIDSTPGAAPAMRRWPIDAVLGSGVLALVLLIVSVVGWLQPWVVLAISFLLLLLVRRDAVAAATEFLNVVRTMPARPAVDRWTAGFTAVFVALLIAAAFAPPTEWDSLMYHLRIPVGLLEKGRLGVPEDSYHVALVGGSHFATLPLLAAGVSIGPALMQVMMLVLVLCGTVTMAQLVGLSRVGSRLTVAVVVGCPVFTLVAITARVDVALVLALVAAHVVLLDAREQGRPRSVLLAALLVGIAISIKPQAGAYALALVPLGWQAAAGGRLAFAAAGLAATVVAPWLLKNQLLTGAPLYPKGSPGWFEPWIAELYGGRVPPPGFDGSALDALPESRATFDLLDAFLHPGRLTVEAEGAYYGLSPAIALVPLVLLAIRSHRAAVGVAVVGLLYSALVIVPFGRINLRYLMPAIPALAIGAAAVVAAVGSRLRGNARRLLVLGFVCAAAVPLGGALRARFFSGGSVLLRHAVGAVSEADVWTQHPDGTARLFAPAIANAQRLLPEDARVVMLWEARALPLGRDALADVLLTNWSYLAQSPAVERCLAGSGVTHVLVNTGALSYYIQRGADRGAFRLDALDEFRRRCLESGSIIGPGFELFRLRTASR